MSLPHDKYEAMKRGVFTQQVLYGSRRQPQPPRNLQNQPGSFKGVITWSEPQDNRGITDYIVYLDNETSPYVRTGISSKRVEVPIISGSTRYVAISSVNAAGVQSQKVPFKAVSNGDQYNGGSTGTSPTAPPSWDKEPTSGSSGTGRSRAVL